tara:strand:+ start:187 stop:1059 length:873 start_codon:yes stop_codon:yes gene_type:complete
MNVLLTIPHVFAPKAGSLYSSQTEDKRSVKTAALKTATQENVNRHSPRHYIHASLGLHKPVVTRELQSDMGVNLTIQVFTDPAATLVDQLTPCDGVQLIGTSMPDRTCMPMLASRRAIEQAEQYDVVGYMEDDLLIEDPEFFHKIRFLASNSGGDYAFLPHRCEQIPGQGDVILSGDPDGGRPDLFWDTGECLSFAWPLGERRFYRATNPHSGCYFLTRDQALRVKSYWEPKEWSSSFQLSGPLEQAGSGILLPVLKVMKPVPAHYRFLMVRHQDQLWTRHRFEAGPAQA